MMMNSIKKNASYIFPRVGLLFVLLWLLWFVNSVIQNTWLVLRNQVCVWLGRGDLGWLHLVLITVGTTECT